MTQQSLQHTDSKIIYTTIPTQHSHLDELDEMCLLRKWIKAKLHSTTTNTPHPSKHFETLDIKQNLKMHRYYHSHFTLEHQEDEQINKQMQAIEHSLNTSETSITKAQHCTLGQLRKKNHHYLYHTYKKSISQTIHHHSIHFAHTGAWHYTPLHLHISAHTADISGFVD